jgi:hypothetical protein
MSLLTTSPHSFLTDRGLAATSRIGNRRGDRDEDLEFLRHNLDERLRLLEAQLPANDVPPRADLVRTLGELGRGLRSDLDEVRDARQRVRDGRWDPLAPGPWGWLRMTAWIWGSALIGVSIALGVVRIIEALRDRF